MGDNLLSGTLPAGATSISRLNDPYLPGYAMVVGAAGVMYVDNVSVATGLSAKPISFLPYRPAGTPRPWNYIADPSMTVTIPDYISSGYGTVAGMLKVRADGLVRKTGIKEPQSAPVIAVSTGTGPNFVTYRYIYRDSTTQAVSNPSPESAPQIVPQSSVNDSQVAATSGVINPNITVNSSQYEGNGTQIRTEGGVSPGTLTDYIIVRNFGLSVPTGVTIDGISISFNWLGQYAGTGVAANVALFYQGTVLGQAKSPGITNAQTPTSVSQGGGSDSWGAIITPDITNDSTFGFGVQVLTAESGGSDRSFFNSFTITVYYTTFSSTGTCTPSLDPQVDTIDVYRQTPGLENFTYVLSVPNSAPSFADTLSDLTIATNPILSFDNYEPFPSIDLPRSGTCTVGAVDQSVSAISIITPGSGQTDGTYIIPSTGGGGTGATVQIVIFGGIITDATVITAGSGYTSAPNFVVAHGGTPGTLAATISPVLPLGANVTWTSGDNFNIRWLPGTIILIQQPGSNSSVAYVLYNRPEDPTHLTAYTTVTSSTGFISFGFPPAGTDLAWQIAEPDLAAQPSPVIWGPTPDNAGSFYFGLDPNNPGDLVWSLGNNFDSSSDSNRMYVTSPSEMLMNGTVTSELSTVFSTDRFWLIYPNFSDAVAAVTGTLGQQWSLVQSASTRGLYMRYAIGALGSLIAWRAKDGIFVSQGGGPEQEISTQIFNLFPHSGQSPHSVVIGSYTVYPPDDTKPDAQTVTIIPGYIFYDYQDTTGTPRTLVYDMEAKGWSVDAYTPNVNCHAWAIGDVDQILLGCADGTVRALDSAGTEASTAVISTPCINTGDARAQKRLGDVFFKATVTASNPVSLALYANRYATALSGFSPTSLTGTGALSSYVVDFTSGIGNDLIDVAAQMSWPVGSGNILEWWEPSWTQLLPDSINDRPTEWNSAGYPGNKLIRGLVLEMDTFNAPKSFSVERSDDNTLRTPGQIPVTVNGQTIVPFTFATPFTAHDLRIISTDGVPWRRSPDAEWQTKWIFDPWPEYAPLRSEWSNLGQQGAKYLRGFVVPLDTQGVLATFTVVTSDGGSVTFTATTPTAKKTPVSFAFNPPIVAHDVQLQMNSNAAVWFEEIRWDFDPYPELTPEYTPIMEVNGSGAKLVRGLNITADTANVSTSFVVSFDGGQAGPTVTAEFNGKQTKAFAFAPFIAHDIQLIPQAAARIWVADSKWDMDPWPEYTALYSSWMNLGTNGAKYIRAVVLPMDTNGGAAVINIVTSDGATVALPSTTTPSGVKTQVAFAFNPPFIAHELRFVPQGVVGLWPEEAKWDFDPYPEIIPEYTPIMELGGADNKFMQGVKLIADTNNQSVTFQILYDGGQTGPTFTGTFNGKQTLIFSWVPFLAHDIQLVPQANARIWWGGIGDGVSEWVFEPYAEAAANYTTEITSLGGVGWQHLRYIDVEYSSTTPINITFTVDTGNGSIAPMPITLPSSGGTQTKIFSTVSANKWKLLGVSATSASAFYLMVEGVEFHIRSWGSSESYRIEKPFGGQTSTGAAV